MTVISLNCALFIFMIFGFYEAEARCPPNEQEVECINFCNTCGVESVCLDMCIPGCDCLPGYLRNKLGKCVPRHQCKASHPDQNLRCPPHEHFVVCSAHCQKNCGNHHKPLVCPFVCVPGCVCDRGFVRGPDYKCIRKENCHVPANSSCPPDEEMSECHAHCQRNCSNYEDPVLPCSRICISGCVCKKGMIRGPDNKCIFPQQCSLKRASGADSLDVDHNRCPPRERFDPCTAHCQKNCNNWMKPIPCSRMCVPGCICEEGFCRGPDGRCIHPEECSAAETKEDVLRK